MEWKQEPAFVLNVQKVFQVEQKVGAPVSESPAVILGVPLCTYSQWENPVAHKCRCMYIQYNLIQ